MKPKKDWRENDPERKTAFLGNGDVFHYNDFYSNIEEQKIDSCMIGRGALIKPWIFEEIKERRTIDKSSSERLDMLKVYSLTCLVFKLFRILLNLVWSTGEQTSKVLQIPEDSYLSGYHSYVAMYQSELSKVNSKQ